MTQTDRYTAHSLQYRLLWSVLLVVGLVWLVVAVATWMDTKHEVGELLDAHLSQAAALLVSQPLEDLAQIVQPETPTLHDYQPKVVLQVWHQNQLVLRSASAPEQPLAQPTQRGFSDITISTKAWRVFSAPGMDPHVVIHVAEQEEARADVRLASMRSVIWPMTIAFPLLGLAIWWAVRSAVQPLKRLGDQVAHRHPGESHPLHTLNVPLEAQPMVQELNRLFARTAELIEAERRFTADAAHELRTPMAAIRMQAQVAQGATDADERNEALQATLKGCDRATHLMEQLLQLARLDTEATIEPEHTDLDACITAVLADLAPMAARRQQRMEWTPPSTAPPLRVSTPPGLTMVLLRNLLDNALRYSPDGGCVRLHTSVITHTNSDTTTSTTGTAPRTATCLTLQDSGPGLSAEDRQRLGERFFRVLGSGQPGSGLGWSIVTRITRLYGMSATVQRSPDLGGLQVTLVW
jgi:two-component system sensor histidine kinase QseC